MTSILDWKKLGISTPPAQTRVVVAMSGGVDSSVTAALLHEAGFEVIGITMQLYDHGLALQKKGACCAGQDIYDAAQVAQKLGFPHYVLDYESRFKQSVIDDFADAYIHGNTPIPCIKCNQTVKFLDLLNAAKDLHADAMVTGHYVQRLQGPNGPELHQGIDPKKDQSYFLFATTNEQLSYLIFPLGGLPKSETRAHATRFGLEVAQKPDSQDICFVPNGNYAEIIQKLRPEAVVPGNVVHLDGTLLGRHSGIINFTVGQRRGLGIGGRKEDESILYVIKVDSTAHEVIVGPKKALAKESIPLKNVNWLALDLLETATKEGVSCTVKCRSAHPSVAARIVLKENQTADVTFATPEYGISPGQACVAYIGSRVLGGGWIA